jgi:CRP-like cAMP-binding protein
MSDAANNALLGSLATEDYALLRPHLTRVHLEHHSILQEPAEPIDDIFFPLEGMISLVASFPEGQEIEIAAIGREGAIGTKVGLLPQVAFSTAIVQLPGVALRMPLPEFQKAAMGNVAITHIATCANDVMLTNLQQAAACNAVHSAEARLARWLLHAQDRYPHDTLPLTQEYMAQMLGVRRTTVSVTASTLEERGLLKYARGKVQIVDRPGLEQLACGCYRIVKANIGMITDAAKRAKDPPK